MVSRRLVKGAMSSLNYDEVASEFDRRYELHAYPGVERCLLDFVSGPQRLRILEVGCGTGRWLARLESAGHDVAGIEPAEQMLARAQARVKADLQHGVAEALPWPETLFDRVIYVNALHHLADPPQALSEAFRVLHLGGRVLSVGLDPHWRVGQWYVYEYFPEALAADLARFPSRQQRTSWLLDAGFTDVAIRVAERLQFERPFDQAVQDGILDRSFTSQLGLLSADEYAAGMRRVRDAARRDPRLTLKVDLELYATEATKP
jgi:SAM-dependent methyltransferase